MAEALKPTKATDAAESEAREFGAHLAVGQRGETLAAEFLRAHGFALVAANFIVPVGRNLRDALIRAEIDLIAYEGETLCFVEVKTRRSDWYAAPEANVDLRKQRQITRAAHAYRRLFNLHTIPFRYDVVTVVLEPISDRELRSAERGKEKRAAGEIDVLSEPSEIASQFDSGSQMSDCRSNSELLSNPPSEIRNPKLEARPRLELLRNFWTEAKFNKRRWHKAGEITFDF